MTHPTLILRIKSEKVFKILFVIAELVEELLIMKSSFLTIGLITFFMINVINHMGILFIPILPLATTTQSPLLFL